MQASRWRKDETSDLGASGDESQEGCEGRRKGFQQSWPLKVRGCHRSSAEMVVRRSGQCPPGTAEHGRCGFRAVWGRLSSWSRYPLESTLCVFPDEIVSDNFPCGDSAQRFQAMPGKDLGRRYWPFLAQRDLEEAGLRPLRERPAEALEDGLHCGCLCLQRGSGRCLLQRGRAAAAAAGNWSLMTWPECNRNQEETWRLETSPRGAEVFHLSDLSRARAGPLGPLGPGPGPGGSGSRVTQRQSAPRSRIFRRRTSTRPTTGSTGSSR
eukprot:s6989_g6.t5